MRKLLIVFILAVILILSGFIWWRRGLGPADPNNHTPQIFVVEQGQGVRQIANKLSKEGLVKDPIVFFLLTKQLGIDKNIEAGDFRLNPAMTAGEIAKELTHGILDIWVTVPEGLRSEEIAEIFEKKLPTYDKSWDAKLSENEGYLFPDTYLIPKEASPEDVIAMMTNTFEKRYAEINSSRSSYSKNQLVTIASLIEREAKHDSDRAIVASVIENRLSIGMKLDIDATLQYALGYQEDEKRWWKKSLTNADKIINSPYNSYTNPGLPPSPISNPGLESLRAAANPAKTDYFYYLTDKNGVNRYAKTLAEHEANIEKYGL